MSYERMLTFKTWVTPQTLNSMTYICDIIHTITDTWEGEGVVEMVNLRDEIAYIIFSTND